MADAGTATQTTDGPYEKGRRGRKPGYGKVPGCGLKKGQKIVTEDVKRQILIKGKPLELLCNVSRGLKIRVGPQAGPGAKYVYPSLQERIAAAKLLLAKVVPDVRHTEISGVGGEPIRAEVQLEAAARVAAVFAEVTNGETKTIDGVAERLPDEALHAASAVNFLLAQREAAAVRDAPPVPAQPKKPLPQPDATAAPPAPDPEPAQPTEPEPPEPGYLVAFLESQFSIRGRAPDRPNLPRTYELLKHGQLVRCAGWSTILEVAKRLMGEPLGAFVVQEPRPQAGGHYNAAEQMRGGNQFPQVQRGWANRKWR